MDEQQQTNSASDARYLDILLDELESLVEGARPVFLTGQVRLDGREALSLLQSVRDAVAEERSQEWRWGR